MSAPSQAPWHLAALPAVSSLAGWGLLLLAVAWSLRSNGAGPAARPGRWAWWLLLLGVLVVFRWPLIVLPHELYPDESQLLAGALTLRHDPVFWRSVDGSTAGPLDYYALLPASFFPGTAGYAAARLTAVLLIWGLLVAAGETLALVTDRRVARIAVLPALAFESLTTSPEFVHYSTELVPGFLLALAVFVSVRQGVQASRGNLWTAALLLGAIPFAKLQAAPIAAALGLGLVIFETAAGRPRHAVLLTGAALLPTLLVAALVTATGQAEHLIIPYFLQNSHYTQIGRLPFGQLIQQFWAQSTTNGHHALWLAGSAVFCTGAVIFARPGPDPLRRHGLAVAALLVVTVGCILAPGHPYHHYLNFLTLPVTLLTGCALALVLAVRARGPNPGPARPVGVFLACTLLPLLVLRAAPRPDPFEYYNTTVTARGPAHRELVARIKNLSSPGESLGLWGWRSSLYVETGRRQANREAHTVFQWLRGPWQSYFLRRYYGDLVAAAPPVFVDAAGPGNFWFDKRGMGHEVFPQLREWVGTHYRLVGEWDGVRLYARLDRLPADR
jgi:hypothetical protein